MTGQETGHETEPGHLVTLRGRYESPPIHLDAGINYEIDLTIGTEQAYPNALDLLEAVLAVARLVDPEGTQATLAKALRDPRIEAACKVMHHAYESAAVGAGWATQKASRKPWADVPEPNKVTMRAAVSALLEHLDGPADGTHRS